MEVGTGWGGGAAARRGSGSTAERSGLHEDDLPYRVLQVYVCPSCCLLAAFWRHFVRLHVLIASY